jgi:hypothetical protein
MCLHIANDLNIRVAHYQGYDYEARRNLWLVVLVCHLYGLDDLGKESRHIHRHRNVCAIFSIQVIKLASDANRLSRAVLSFAAVLVVFVGTDPSVS